MQNVYSTSDYPPRFCVALTHNYLLSSLLRTLYTINVIDGAEEEESVKGEENGALSTQLSTLYAELGTREWHIIHRVDCRVDARLAGYANSDGPVPA